MKVLDLCCGAGGAAMGLHRAWPDAEITGVDIAPQKRYPFTFIQTDALTFPLDGYDFIWASPLCKNDTQLQVRWGRTYPDLITPLRARLRAWGGPWIMENVVGAPLENAVMLCGTMFGLKVYRHRLFESNQLLMVPPHVPHQDKTPRWGGAISPKGYITVTGHCGNMAYARPAMGIPWMSLAELSQAIPPAYSEYLARQLTPLFVARTA